MEAAETNNQGKAASSLNHLAIQMYTRAKRTGQLQDLEKSIKLLRLANKLTPDDSPDKPFRLSNLAISITARFELEGRAEDLEEAIQLSSLALDLLPDDHADNSELLHNLGGFLSIRFNRLGVASDLEKAISLQNRAVELIPDDHPNKPMWLINLGITLDGRFNRFGDLEDLEKAIRLKEQSIMLTSDDHPNKPGYMNNAGASYEKRFARLGNLGDVERAVTLYTHAVRLRPDDHPEKPSILNNLAGALGARYARAKNLSDLEEAIAQQTRAVGLARDNHPDRHSLLNTLALKLYQRYKRSESLDDLREAIAHQTDAMELTPEEHPHKPSRLHNLSNLLRERFKQAGDVEDLERAMVYARQSIKLRPESHPDSAMNSRHLGHLFVARLHSQHAQADDATHAMAAFLDAMRHPSSPPIEKLQASLNYAELLAEFPQLSIQPLSLSLLQSYKHAIGLISECIWLGNDVRGRYTSEELRVVRQTGSDAAAAAITAGKYSLALEWLEAGRGVVWSQILQLRIPLDDLRRLNPQLAGDLHRVSQALQCAANSPSSPFFTSDDGLSLLLSSLGIQTQSSHSSTLEYNRLITQIRKLEGFETFLLPKTFSQLVDVCASGPVVVISVNQSRCDALILYPPGKVRHVPLPAFSLDHAIKLLVQLRAFLRQKHLLGRFRGDVQSKAEQRGGRTSRKDEVDPLYAILADLWTQIVKPVVDVVKALTASDEQRPHITWCPTGPLVFLPLHAAGLYSQNGPSHTTVMDLVVSSYTPTLEALLKPRPRASRSNNDTRYPKMLLVSQPSAPGLPIIPGASTEARIIESLIEQPKVLKDDEGTVETVLEGMTTHDWVHLACHGVQNSEDPTNSAFALHDKRLLLSTLMSRSLQNADLAVLSACQTATGDVKLPEEAVHLAAGMLNVGYKSVIGTMWSISDRSAPVAMGRFYEVMVEQLKAKGELQPAYALHEATKLLREKYGATDFVRWVPFVHFGL